MRQGIMPSVQLGHSGTTDIIITFSSGRKILLDNFEEIKIAEFLCDERLKEVAKINTKKTKQSQLKNFPGTILQAVRHLILKDPAFEKEYVSIHFRTKADQVEFRKFVDSFPGKEKTWIKIKDRLKENSTLANLAIIFLNLIIAFIDDTKIKGQYFKQWIEASEKLCDESKAKLLDANSMKKLCEGFEAIRISLMDARNDREEGHLTDEPKVIKRSKLE